MRTTLLWMMTLTACSVMLPPAREKAKAPTLTTFRHQYIDTSLPITNGWIGDYGQTALVDIDHDGRLDFVIGRKRNDNPVIEGTIYWYRNLGPGGWKRTILGRDSPSDVGAAALDIDGDGWIDLICGGAWYRNPRAPREKEFTRHIFDPDGEAVHDVVAADIDGDGRPEIVTLSDKQGMFWYKPPADPTRLWEKHWIGPGVHGAIAPAGIGDLNGDGRPDLVRVDTWFENPGTDGEWIPHPNLPFGKPGPYGLCTRTVVIDIDGDGRNEIVTCDADVVGSKMAILKNMDGKGGRWERRDLPQSFRYGSLHSLAVADFTGDGRLDIVSCEQEELLPEGRENPRFVMWENRGKGRFTEKILLDAKLGGHELQVGDVNGDGRLDIVSKAWGVSKWNGVEGKMHVDCLINTPE